MEHTLFQYTTFLAVLFLSACAGLETHQTTAQDLLKDDSEFSELTPFPPDTNDRELGKLYSKVDKHFRNEEVKQAIEVLLIIIDEYSGIASDKHRRWSCYSLYRIFLNFGVKEPNRADFDICPNDLVATLYGDVDREPILIYFRFPRFPKTPWNRSIVGTIIVEFDITKRGQVENVVVVDLDRASMRYLESFAVELFESHVYLPKIAHGQTVAVYKKQDTIDVSTYQR